jgi:hypothetical protein
MYTLIDLKDLQAARINEEQGTIVIFLKEREEPIFIHEDDLLYEVYRSHFEKEFKNITK